MMGRCCRERWQPWIVFRLWCCSHLGASGYLRSTPVLGGLGTCTSRAVTWMGYDGMVPGASAHVHPIFPSSHPRLFVAQGLGTWEAPFELNVADPLCLGMHCTRWGWLGGRFQGYSEAAQLRKGGMAFGFNRCCVYLVRIRFQDFLFKNKLAACDAMDCMCRWFVWVLSFDLLGLHVTQHWCLTWFDGPCGFWGY